MKNKVILLILDGLGYSYKQADGKFRRLENADIFIAVKAAGGNTAAEADLFFSDYFQSSIKLK